MMGKIREKIMKIKGKIEDFQSQAAESTVIW
jgi:hypothetical protein